MFCVYSRHVKSGTVTYIGSFSTMEEAVSKIRQCYNIDVKICAKDEYYYFVKECGR